MFCNLAFIWMVSVSGDNEHIYIYQHIMFSIQTSQMQQPEDSKYDLSVSFARTSLHSQAGHNEYDLKISQNLNNTDVWLKVQYVSISHRVLPLTVDAASLLAQLAWQLAVRTGSSESRCVMVLTERVREL